MPHTPSSLTDRYIAVAVRSVPLKVRSDLAAELGASIADQVDGRVEMGEPEAVAERAVLEQMGDPDRLAADYADRPTFLIGPRYYFDWLRLLKLLMWIMVPIATVAIALARLLSGGTTGDVVASIFSGAISVGVHVAFWTTLVFVILERSSPKQGGPLTPWSLDRLPDPVRRAALPDLVASLVFLGLVVAAVVWDRLLGLAWVDGEMTAVLNPGLWPWWITGLFVLVAAEAALAVAVYRGGYTIVLAVVNALISAAVAVPAILLLADGRLVSPVLVERLFGAAGDDVTRIATAVGCVAIGAIGAWDAIDGFRKALVDRARA
jgi:hypothetical protein